MIDQPPGWLGGLDPAIRESIYELMREWGGKAEKYNKEATWLYGDYPAIPAGYAFLGPLIRGQGIEIFLRGLRRGMAPIEAREGVAKFTAETVAKWNNRRPKDFHSHRSPDAEASFFDCVLRTFNDAIKRAAS